ncbi:MAG TPA: hypothetical protein DD670_18065 [Planctomycetaceae bacterium]|nr:hypothetical protein [Planctomycetaceae bacterium]
MGVSVTEKFGSRQTSEGENPSIELRFTIAGSDDDIEVKTSLLAASPVFYDGLVRQSAQIEQIGPLLWDGSVRYGQRKRPETGDSNFAFDTGGGTQHITQSLQTLGRYAPVGVTAPDFQGAIGATSESVEGVDVTVPVYNFSETHYIAAEMVSGAYKAALFALTGRVNAASFRGFAAGEVLFLGASGSKRGEEDWEITFRFAVSPGATGITVGPITGINKRGWDYLWVRYQDAEDAAAGALVKRPVAAYVERVYYDGDFSGLGIGV